MIKSPRSDSEAQLLSAIKSNANVRFFFDDSPMNDDDYRLEAKTESVIGSDLSDLLEKVGHIEFDGCVKFIVIFCGGLSAPTITSPTPWALFRYYSETEK